MVDVRGDVLRPPQCTTPAAVKANKKNEVVFLGVLPPPYDWLKMREITLTGRKTQFQKSNSALL